MRHSLTRRAALTGGVATLAASVSRNFSHTTGFDVAIAADRTPRLSADSVNVADFCDKRLRNTDLTDGFRRALSFCISNHRSTIIIPDEDFVCEPYTANGSHADIPRSALNIDRCPKIEIKGEGARIYLGGKDRRTYSHLLSCSNGKGLRVSGQVSFDFQDPPFTQGVCTSKDASSASFAVDWIPAFSDVQRIVEFDPATRMPVQIVLDRPKQYASGALSLMPLDDRQVKVNLPVSLDKIEIGKTYALVHQVYGFNTIHAENIDSLEIDGRISIFASGGMGIFTRNVESVVVAGDSRVEARRGRLVSMPADGIHVINSRQEVRIAPAHVANTGDDGINVTSMFSFMVGSPQGSSFRCGLSIDGAMPRKADVLEAINPDGVRVPLGQVVDAGGGNPALVTMDRGLPSGFASNWWISNVSVSPSVDLAPRLVEQVRGNGARVRSANVRVKGTFRNITDSAVYAAVGVWPEGPYPTAVEIDVTAENTCTYQNGSIAAIWIGASAPKATLVEAPVGAIKNASVTGSVSQCKNKAIFIGSAQHARVYNVQIDKIGQQQRNSAIMLDNCGSFEISNTASVDEKRKIRVEDCGIGTVTHLDNLSIDKV